jgi:hypothetical protein
MKLDTRGDFFPADTYVLTARGLLAMQDVVVGDRVLTHTQQWRNVAAIAEGIADTLVISGGGHGAFETTPGHALLTRGVVVERDANGQYRSTLCGPDWMPASELLPTPSRSRRGAGDLWASLDRFGDPLPIPAVAGGCVEFSSDFFWNVGCWLIDNCWHVGPSTMPARVARVGAVERPCNLCGAPHANRSGCGELRRPAETRRKESAAASFPRGLLGWLHEHFATELDHTIPAWALTMEPGWRRPLLEGCLSTACRSSSQSGSVRVGKRCAVALRLLATSLGHTATVRSPIARPVGVIDGRAVTTRPVFSLGWSSERSAELAVGDFAAGGIRWSFVSGSRPGHTAVPVYALSVDGDSSYLADGIIVRGG